MKVGRNESWVTLVEDDRMGLEALVLAASLKRQLTLRKLTALIDDIKVSPQIQRLLRDNFDFVETLQNVSVVYGAKNFASGKDTSKNLLWSLLLWKKCVFVASDCIALSSVELLFEAEELTAPRIEVKGQQSMNLDLFVYKPGRETLKSLLAASARTKSGNHGILKHFWKSWSSTPSKKVKDGLVMNVLPAHLHLHCPRPKIVRFETSPWISNVQGMSWKKYNSIWLQIFAQDILPQIQKFKELEQFLQTILTDFYFPLNFQNSPISPLTTTNAEELTDAIAVIGMSCRFPGANSVEEYWDLLTQGSCAVGKFPENRRTNDIPGIRNVVGGFLSCGVDEFDAKFFGISPREAPLIDPQQRLLLEVIWESLEDAGIDGSLLKDTPTGVFIGILTQDYDRILPKNMYIGNEYHHRFLGNAISATAGRISYFMGFTGPNLALESGSSSSLAAIHLGCQSLRSGESNLVITGGVNLVLLPRDCHDTIVSPDVTHVPSAEGVGTIVLKRYVDAVRDGDHIRALIRGSALGNDGGSVGHGTPVASKLVHVCAEALNNAGVLPCQVGYVEGHGSGTPIVDKDEVKALSHVYSVDRSEPLWIGSVKSNIGHAESAGGIASIIKLILALENETIPENLFFENSNPKLPVGQVAPSAPTSLIPWTGSRRFGAANSLSLTGTIVHTILESAPAEQRLDAVAHLNEESQPELILISAKTPEALEAQYKNYLELFKSDKNLSISQIAFATNLNRTHFSHRVAVAARDMADLIEKLEQKDCIGGKIASNTKSPPVAFLFTGQTSEYLGMAEGLYTVFEPFRSTIEYCSEIFSTLSGHSLTKILFEDEVLLKEFAQPAIFCVQIALVKLWRHFGIRPTAVLGHSVGEYCAAVAADVMSIEDGLKLVIARSQLVRRMRPGAMVALKGDLMLTQELLTLEGLTSLEIAAINSPTQVILAGSIETVETFEAVACSRDLKTHRLPSKHAFHSRDVDSILAEFGAVAQGISYKAPSCTYISSTLGRPLSADDFCSEYWQCHLRDTIQFSHAVTHLTTISSTLIEIGPQPVLLGLAVANKDSTTPELVCCPSLRRVEADWFTFYSALAKLHVSGVGIDWSAHFATGAYQRMKLPLYPFQRQKYWFILKDYTDEEDEKERDGIYIKAQRIHPILGYRILTPQKMIFAQSKLLQELPYLKNCTIAHVPFLTPGGVIELFLAAANQTRKKTNFPPKFKLTNIKFVDYLRLDKEKSIQTVVENGIANLYVEEPGDASKWNLLATAQVKADDSDWSKEQEKCPDWFRRTEIVSDWVEMPIDHLYASSTQVEVHFGQNYRRISKVWRVTDDIVATELSTMVQDPEKVGQSCSSYVAFPTILDAMIQSARVTKFDTICLPKKIDSFTWFVRDVSSNQLMVYCYQDDIYLVTRSGQLMATLTGLEFMTGDEGLDKLFIEEEAPLTPVDLGPTQPLDISHINLPLDTDDKRLQILAEIIARPGLVDEEVVERKMDVTGKLDFKTDDDKVIDLQSLPAKLEMLLRQTLRLPPSEILELDQNFTEIGIDSLMGLEIGAKLQTLIPDRPISATIVQEYPTLRSLLAELGQE